ncbi:MAG: hypothetical protein ABJG15_12480 [Hyphomonadaceae bacterium]
MTNFIQRMGFAILGSLCLAGGVSAQDSSPTNFHEEYERSVWHGVFDIGISYSSNYWDFWSGKSDPVEMLLADSPDAIREGRWDTVMRTGKGFRYEAIGNDGVAGLVAYGTMKDPRDPTKWWVKVIDEGAFTWTRLLGGFPADMPQLINLPTYGSGSLITRTIEMSETAGGPTVTRVFAPPNDGIETYSEGYGMAEVEVLDHRVVDVADGEAFWDLGLEPEASAPKNVWVKVRIYDLYSQYGELTFREEDTKVLAEGWMRLFGADGTYQIAYSPKGC